MDRDVLVVGESLIDIVRGPDGSMVEYAGGSAANVAVALARLGRPVRFASSWADDDRGRVLDRHVTDAGVALASDPLAVGAHLDRARHDRQRRRGGVRVRPRVAPAPGGGRSRPAGGAHLLPGRGAGARRRRRARRCWTGCARPRTISYDVNARPAITGTGPDVVARVERVVAVCDLVKASDEDLAALYPGVPTLEAARRLLGAGPGGGRGDPRRRRRHLGLRRAATSRWPRCRSTWPTRSGPATPSGPRCSTRCGSAGGSAPSTATGCAALDAAEVADVLAHAARAAAITVSRPGADPPYRRELD